MSAQPESRTGQPPTIENAIFQAERAQAKKHSTLWGGGRGLRGLADLSVPHALAARQLQGKPTLMGSPAWAMGGGYRKYLVSRRRELIQGRNSQPACEGRGGRARGGCTALIHHQVAAKSTEPASHVPRVIQERNLAEAVSLYPFLLDLLLHPLTSPTKVSTDVQSSQREAEPRGLDICLCPACQRTCSHKRRSPNSSG